MRAAILNWCDPSVFIWYYPDGKVRRLNRSEIRYIDWTFTWWVPVDSRSNKG